MIMISLPRHHILMVVQQLVPSNVHLCKYICSLWLSCGYLQFLLVKSSRELGHQQHRHDLLEHIQAIETSALAQSMHNESRKPQDRRTYIWHKCEMSMR
jgi:hypothetical protein